MTVETKDLTKAEIGSLSDKCEKLEKQLKIAIKALSKYADIHNWDFIDGDDEKGCSFWDMSENGCEEACVALSKIKELDK